MSKKERKKLMAGSAGALTVRTTCLDEHGLHVYIDIRAGGLENPVLVGTYMSSDQARDLAAALLRAANHYDAETARLAADTQA